MKGSFTPDLSKIDLLTLIGNDTNLRRVAGTNGGEWAGPCPFCQGVDRFRVQPNHPDGKGLWYCRGCGEERWHDAIDYIRRRDNLGFREACERLGVALSARATTRRKPSKAEPIIKQEATRPTWDTSAALSVVEECEAALWADAGARARKWLAARGLAYDTIRRWRLGYSAGREVRGLFVPRGIVIPCFVDGTLWYIKVRRPVPPLPGPKYKHVKGSRPALYGLDFLDGKGTVVICEGEFDAMLLWQEAGDLVDTVALGSKDAKPALPFLAHLAGATRWLVALDNDADKAAAWWGEFSARAQRVRPLQGNDLTDFHLAGGNLRAWVTYHLGRLEAETRPLPERLDALDAVASDHDRRLADLEADLLPRCQRCGRVVHGWPRPEPGGVYVCVGCLGDGGDGRLAGGG